MHNPGRRASVPYRHVERFHDEVGSERVTHRPAHDAAAPGIQHRRQVKPALARRDVGHVRNPQLIRPEGCKIALHEVRGCDGVGILPRRAPVPPPLGTGQVGVAHQPRYPLPPTPHALRMQLRVDPRRSVRSPAPLVNGPNLSEQAPIRLRSRR